MSNAYSMILENAEKQFGKGSIANYEVGNSFKKLLKENKDKVNFSLRAVYDGVVDPKGDIARRDNPVLIAEAIGSSALPYITDAYFSDITLGVYENYKNTAELALVTEGTGNKTSFEEIRGMLTNEDLALRRPQMPYEEGEIGDKKVGIFYSDFGRIVSVTWEAIYDDQTGDLIDTVHDLADKGMKKVAQAIIETIEMGTARSTFEETANKGFYYNGSVVAASDFYSNDHTSTVDGVTNDNVDASGGTVTWANLNTAYNLLANMVDSRGDHIVVNADTMLIPQGQAIATYQMLGATATAVNPGIDSGTAHENIPNFFRQKVKNVVESPYVTSTNWFMGEFKKQVKLNWIEKPTTASQGADSEQAFSRKVVYRFKVNTHFGVANTDYRYVVKSNS